MNAAEKSGEKPGWEKPEWGLRIAQGCPPAGARVGSGKEGCVRWGWGMLSRSFPCAGLMQGAGGDSSPRGAGQDGAVPTL